MPVKTPRTTNKIVDGVAITPRALKLVQQYKLDVKMIPQKTYGAIKVSDVNKYLESLAAPEPVDMLDAALTAKSFIAQHLKLFTSVRKLKSLFDNTDKFVGNAVLAIHSEEPLKPRLLFGQPGRSVEKDNESSYYGFSFGPSSINGMTDPEEFKKLSFINGATTYWRGLNSFTKGVNEIHPASWKQLSGNCLNGRLKSGTLASYFNLLHGVYELSMGMDPEFFANVFPHDAKLMARHTPRVAPDGFAFELHPNAARCYNNVRSYLKGAAEDVAALPDAKLFAGASSSASPAKPVLTMQPRLDLTPEMIAEASKAHITLGCNPSENIYGMGGDLDAAQNDPRRWAGGHLHFDLPIAHRNAGAVSRCVENLDALAGLAEVAVVGHMMCPDRRRYYGLAGEYRTKPYGLEYRTLSNQWLGSGQIFYLIGELARMAVKIAIDGLTVYDLGFRTMQPEVIDIINTTDQARAREVMKQNADFIFATFVSRDSTYHNPPMLPMFMLFGQNHWTKNARYYYEHSNAGPLVDASKLGTENTNFNAGAVYKWSGQDLEFIENLRKMFVQ